MILGARLKVCAMRIFNLGLDSTPGSIVPRIYEHDASLCQKEVDMLRVWVAAGTQIVASLSFDDSGWTSRLTNPGAPMEPVFMSRAADANFTIDSLRCSS